MNGTVGQVRWVRFAPILLVMGIFVFALSILIFAHSDILAGSLSRPVAAIGWSAPAIGLLVLLASLAAFGRSVLLAAPDASRDALNGARTAMLLFIVSEAVLFAALFAAYFYFSFGSSPVASDQWPPAGLAKPRPWGTPLIGAMLLLASGAAAVAAHQFFLRGRRRNCEILVAAAILLGVAFLALQIREFANADFAYQDGAYPSVFFMATGLHGVHVFVGVVLLAIALLRLAKGHFSMESHFGLEAPIWYWHFVDAVWILLFAVFYVSFA